MSREKQIEEMERIIQKCDDEAMYASIADSLYDAGYRKQSENTVEVVRCKDCKHYKPQTQSKRWDNKTKYCCRCAVVKVKDNDFCSYGEPIMKGGAE